MNEERGDEERMVHLHYERLRLGGKWEFNEQENEKYWAAIMIAKERVMLGSYFIQLQ